MAVRCPVPVSHRPISPPSSPAARVWPSGLNATLSIWAALGQGGGPLSGAGVPQADIAAVVADGERRAVRAERHAVDTVLPWVRVAVRLSGAGVPQADMAAVVAGGEGLCRPG